jgi:hypothetical protein
MRIGIKIFLLFLFCSTASHAQSVTDYVNPILRDSLGIPGTFFIFSGFCVITFFYVSKT